MPQSSIHPKPVVDAAIAALDIGGRPALDTIGFSNMDATVSFTGAAFTVNAVAMYDDNGSSAYARLASIGASGANDYDTGLYVAAILRTGANQEMCSYRVSQLTTGAITFLTPFVITVVFSGTTQELFIGGVSKGTAASTGSLSATMLRIFNDTTNGSFRWTGRLSELVISKTAWDSTQRSAIEAEQMTYYGIA
jgi:hypothetical protein